MLRLIMQPAVLNRSEHNVSRKDISFAAIKVLCRLKEEGYTDYIAGGGVRDLLLNRHPETGHLLGGRDGELHDYWTKLRISVQAPPLP